MGKTRLAARAADAARADRAVAWVGLADLREPQPLPDTVAAALGHFDRKARSRTDIVIDHLREHRVPLVLDNREHLIEATEPPRPPAGPPTTARSPPARRRWRRWSAGE